MKQVINITLGGRVFAIEQDAYDTLAVYLDQIKVNLTNTDDAKEIVDDIENAIAEKFIARKRSEKLAVTRADVDTIVGELGSPADFKEETEHEPNTAKTAATQAAPDGPKKRLYRDSDDVVIAGVASGLANYSGIDPVIVRLIFVVFTFFNGFGILAYIVLWLVVPKAETTAEKYAMRGERVTLKEISERVKKNIEDIEPLANDATRSTWLSVRGFLNKLFGIVGAVVRFAIVVIRFFFGIVMVIGGALGLAALVSLYSVILLSEKVFFPHDVQVVLDMLMSNASGIIAMVSSFLVMAIPLIVIIIAGSSLMAKRSYFTVQKSVTLAVIWIVAAAIAGTTSALQVEQVMQKIVPVEGRFDDNSFEILWERGEIYGNDKEVHIRYEDTVDGTKAYVLTDDKGLVEVEIESDDVNVSSGKDMVE